MKITETGGHETGQEESPEEKKSVSSGATDGGLNYQPKFEKHFLLPKYWGTWFLVGVLRLLMYMPRIVRDLLALMLGKLIRRVSAKRYRIAKKNLSLCFNQKTEREIEKLVSQFFFYQARVMLDYAFLWFANDKRLAKLYKIKHDGELRGLQAINKPVILLTCHTLALDHGAQALSLDYPIVGLFKPLRNPVLNWLVTRGRVRFNTKIFDRVYGMMGVVSGVKDGSLHFYIPDEDLGDKHAEFLPFFGIQKSTITALPRLARICDAVVLPVVSNLNRKTGQYEIEFLPSLSPYPTGDKLADALSMNQTIEKLILKSPEQYIWTFRYFKTRPEGESPVY